AEPADVPASGGIYLVALRQPVAVTANPAVAAATSVAAVWRCSPGRRPAMRCPAPTDRAVSAGGSFPDTGGLPAADCTRSPRRRRRYRYSAIPPVSATGRYAPRGR